MFALYADEEVVALSSGLQRVEAHRFYESNMGFENSENPWDMGPTTTLTLAVVFTLALIKIKRLL